MFHNTSDIHGAELVTAAIKTMKQDDIVMEYFDDHPGYHSPSQVWKQCLSQAPLTSVRRSITDLTSEGKLEKTTHQVKGLFGSPEYCWKQPTTQGALF